MNIPLDIAPLIRQSVNKFKIRKKLFKIGQSLSNLKFSKYLKHIKWFPTSKKNDLKIVILI